MESPRAFTRSNFLVAAGVAACLSLVGYATYKYMKKVSYKVLQVDTKPLDHITDHKLLDSLFLLAQQAFDNIMKDGKANN